MPASKGIAAETIMKFIQASVECISQCVCHYYITKLLSYIVEVVINAEEVFAITNTNELLQAIIGQVLVMLVSYIYN